MKTTNNIMSITNFPILKQWNKLLLVSALTLMSIGMVNSHGGDTANMYCTTECTATNAANPCGDGYGQTSSCNAVNVTMPSSLGYANETELPNGFLGCTDSVCLNTCKDVNTTNPLEIVVGSDGAKTFCFPKRETGDGMFMMKDVAEVSAVSRGCSGSHQMGDMYMQGSTHPACAESYHTEGVAFGSDGESSSHQFIMHSSIIFTLCALVFSVLIL